MPVTPAMNATSVSMSAIFPLVWYSGGNVPEDKHTVTLGRLCAIDETDDDALVEFVNTLYAFGNALFSTPVTGLTLRHDTKYAPAA